MHTGATRQDLEEFGRQRSNTTTVSSVKPRYFDYNATTPLIPSVIDVMTRAMHECWGNPSSLHVYGKESRAMVDTARVQVSSFINCSTDELVFTSGGTESINYALRGCALSNAHNGRHIITSVVEHPAVLETVRALERDEGFQVTYLPVNRFGMVETSTLESALQDDTILVSIMLANNEVGTINPIAELVKVARSRPNVLFHTDASQAIGKIVVDCKHLGVDYLTVAGHKLYAPKGVGALYIRDGTPPLRKLIHGAHHEQNRRAGTENVILVSGLGQACSWLSQQGCAVREHCRKMVTLLKREIVEELKVRTTKDVSDIVRFNVHPVASCSLPNTLSVSFCDVMVSKLMDMILDYVAVSAGAACNDECKPSYVLSAMGVPLRWAQGTVRVSVGIQTTEDDCIYCAKVLIGAVLQQREQSENVAQ